MGNRHQKYHFPKKKGMKKHLQTSILWLLFITCISCGTQSKTEPSKDAIGPNSITRTIKQGSNGNIWLATWEGIIRYDGSSFTNITKEVSLSRFFAVLEDRKGNFWFASVGSGVYCYDGDSFQNFTTRAGLANDRVTHIYEDKKGNIWFGTEVGAGCYDGETFRNFTTNEGLPHNSINAIIEDKTGRFWLGTNGDACFYDGKNFTTITNQDGMTFKNVRSIIRDQKGHMWLGGQDGLWRYDGSTFTNFNSDFVGYIYEDKKGNIWTSSKRNTSQGWTLSYYEEQSLSNNKPIAIEILTNGGMFFGILEDSESNIWLGTLNGVYRYDGSVFEDFKDEKLLKEN